MTEKMNGEQFEKLIGRVFQNPDGRKFLDQMGENLMPTFQVDARAEAFNLGQHAVILEINEVLKRIEPTNG